MMHDWIAVASYELTEAEAGRIRRAQVSRVPADVQLDVPNRWSVDVGCWRCERELGDAQTSELCRGWARGEAKARDRSPREAAKAAFRARRRGKGRAE